MRRADHASCLAIVPVLQDALSRAFFRRSEVVLGRDPLSTTGSAMFRPSSKSAARNATLTASPVARSRS